MAGLTAEKLTQAAEIVSRSEADVWLTFVRETADGGDPVLPLILSGGLTWDSALIVTKQGKRTAIVGNFDAEPLIASGDWDYVVPYVQSIREPLLEELEKTVSPGGKIAVNFSINDSKADGLSHGMFLHLKKLLARTRFSGSLVSAEKIVTELRSRKTPEELRRMLNVIANTLEVFGELGSYAKRDMSEKHLFDWIHAKAAELGLGFSWDPAGDPIVNSGPDSMIGHGIASDKITLQPGHVFHVDLGLTREGYSSDIQRCWYVGETVPHDVLEALHAVNGAITAAAKVLKPGALGWQVDAAARSYLMAKGYPEYMHATGHQVGRVAHDGGAILGPRWERYGATPKMPIRQDEVYTLELGVELPGRGYLGIEEMVVVTESGCDWLSERQWDMPTIQ